MAGSEASWVAIATLLPDCNEQFPAAAHTQTEAGRVSERQFILNKHFNDDVDAEKMPKEQEEEEVDYVAAAQGDAASARSC